MTPTKRPPPLSIVDLANGFDPREYELAQKRQDYTIGGGLNGRNTTAARRPAPVHKKPGPRTTATTTNSPTRSTKKNITGTMRTGSTDPLGDLLSRRPSATARKKVTQRKASKKTIPKKSSIPNNPMNSIANGDVRQTRPLGKRKQMQEAMKRLGGAATALESNKRGRLIYQEQRRTCVSSHSQQQYGDSITGNYNSVSKDDSDNNSELDEWVDTIVQDMIRRRGECQRKGTKFSRKERKAHWHGKKPSSMPNEDFLSLWKRRVIRQYEHQKDVPTDAAHEPNTDAARRPSTISRGSSAVTESVRQPSTVSHASSQSVTSTAALSLDFSALEDFHAVSYEDSSSTISKHTLEEENDTLPGGDDVSRKLALDQLVTDMAQDCREQERSLSSDDLAMTLGQRKKQWRAKWEGPQSPSSMSENENDFEVLLRRTIPGPIVESKGPAEPKAIDKGDGDDAYPFSSIGDQNIQDQQQKQGALLVVDAEKLTERMTEDISEQIHPLGQNERLLLVPTILKKGKKEWRKKLGLTKPQFLVLWLKVLDVIGNKYKTSSKSVDGSIDGEKESTTGAGPVSTSMTTPSHTGKPNEGDAGTTTSESVFDAAASNATEPLSDKSPWAHLTLGPDFNRKGIDFSSWDTWEVSAGTKTYWSIVERKQQTS